MFKVEDFAVHYVPDFFLTLYKGKSNECSYEIQFFVTINTLLACFFGQFCYSDCAGSGL